MVFYPNYLRSTGLEQCPWLTKHTLKLDKYDKQTYKHKTEYDGDHTRNEKSFEGLEE